MPGRPRKRPVSPPRPPQPGRRIAVAVRKYTTNTNEITNPIKKRATTENYHFKLWKDGDEPQNVL